jgi:integrase
MMRDYGRFAPDARVGIVHGEGIPIALEGPAALRGLGEAQALVAEIGERHRGRGRKPSGPKLLARDRGKGKPAVYAIYDRGKYVATTGVTDLAAAQKALTLQIIQTALPSHMIADPRSIRLDAVLEWRIAQVEMDQALSETTRQRKLRILDHALRFVGSGVIGDLPRLTFNAWVAFRMKELQGLGRRLPDGTREREPINGKFVSAQTAGSEGKIIQEALTIYLAAHGLPALTKWTGRIKTSRRTRVLNRNEIAAMLWACRGRRRAGPGETSRNGWLAEWVEDPETGERRLCYVICKDKRAAYENIALLIRIGIEAGCRESEMRALRIMPHQEDGWVDFQKNILHRGGISRDGKGKPRYSSEVPKRLITLLEHRKAVCIARGATTFLCDADGEPCRRSLHELFLDVVDDAGLGETDVTQHTLRHTVCTELAHEHGLSIPDAARYVGMSVEAFFRTYVKAVDVVKGRAVDVQTRRQFARDQVMAPRHSPSTPISLDRSPSILRRSKRR